ncbi:MAG TPA: TldD/PmbA family protein [Elusimicrobiota bacterium]|nr:TldD/PmbA family protein [Elusimicrobiota bacterium]
MNFSETAPHLIGLVRSSRSLQTEVYLTEEDSRTVEWAEGKPSDTERVFGQGMAVRVTSSGRQGLAFANRISEEDVLSLHRKACSSAAYACSDPCRMLPTPSSRPVRTSPRHGLFSMSVDEQQRWLSHLEKDVLKFDKRLKKIVRMGVREGRTHFAVANTRGVDVSHQDAEASFSIELMAEQRGEVQVAWITVSGKRLEDIPVDDVLAQVRDRALNSLGARPLDSGEWTVLLDPWVGVEFMNLLSEALCADAVQAGRSIFKGRIGHAVASPRVTIVDDGTLEGGISTAPVDEEGVPTQRTTLIGKGRLRGYLYDTYTARKDRVESTGNGYRAGLSAPPAPDSSNFYMIPGTTSREDLIGRTSRAFWVREVMGMHTADPVSGDFSLGASGLLVEKGKIVRAVKGVTLAGNIRGLLKNIEEVARDLTWYGSTGCPTMRVRSLSVGGSETQRGRTDGD